MNKKRTAYVWEQTLIEHCDRLPAVIGRASMVHDLISAYGLLKNIKVIKSIPATNSDLKLFHSDLYLDHLKTFNHVSDDFMPSAEDEEYGIGYDCPPVSDMYNIISTIAGSSLTAAKCLLLDIADVVINWCGGWHHAHRFGAEGFCYVNDIVIAIEKLRLKFPKILYIDMDIHHGNGVQDAYNISKSVFTLSFHKYEPGFYPGTGSLDDIGTLNGKGFVCNIPLHACYSDKTFKYTFDSIFSMVYSYFVPDAIVVQCGADALARDPHGGAGLTLDGYQSCIRSVINKSKPTLLLGGGGYNISNTAKLWASLTALVTDIKLDNNIPEHHFWPKYGPDYTLTVQPLLAKDLNTKEYIENCISIVGESNEIEENAEPCAKKRKVEIEANDVKIHSMLKSKLNFKSEQNNKSKDPYEFLDY
ncbi:unnamed protein product, partial [Brenthis ino]